MTWFYYLLFNLSCSSQFQYFKPLKMFYRRISSGVQQNVELLFQFTNAHQLIIVNENPLNMLFETLNLIALITFFFFLLLFFLLKLVSKILLELSSESTVEFINEAEIVNIDRQFLWKYIFFLCMKILHRWKL